MAIAIDPEDETFWKQMRESVTMVSAQHERVIEFTVGSRKAEVMIDPGPPRTIHISISDYNPPQPALLVP